MKEIGIHIHGKGAKEKRYIVYPANDGNLHLYRTWFSKNDGVNLERIVTNTSDVNEVSAFLTKRRVRRKRRGKSIQFTIFD